MQQCPTSDPVLSRHKMAVETLAGKKEPIHIVHVAVDHVTGAMSLWEIVGIGIEIGVHAKLENSVKGRTISQII